MQKIIETERLLLRPFRLGDSERVAKLAGDKVIADMTAQIPHPYEPSMAVAWIETHQPAYDEGRSVVYAITIKGNDDIIGTVSLPSLNGGLGVLGYWLGVEFWGNGYAYEASRALVDYCKENLGLKQLEVSHLVGNERSKSVINKLAVTYMENKVVTVHGRDREVSVYRSEI